MDTRTCVKCGDSFPMTREFFKPDKACKNGLVSVCRACSAKNRRKWYGETRDVRVQQLRDFHKNNPKMRKEYEIAWEGRDPYTRRATIIFHGAKKHAVQKGVPFDELLSSSMIREWLLRQSHCSCCGRVFHVKQKAKNDAAPTLDRFDSDGGYTLDNLSLICWRCNRVKCDATLEELETVVQWMKTKLEVP